LLPSSYALIAWLTVEVPMTRRGKTTSQPKTSKNKQAIVIFGAKNKQAVVIFDCFWLRAAPDE
jgi:hypothetical protein